MDARPAAALLACVLLLPGCASPAEGAGPFPRQRYEALMADPGAPGVNVRAIIEADGEAARLDATATNSGTATYQVAAVCTEQGGSPTAAAASPWGHHVAGEGGPATAVPSRCAHFY